MQKPRFDRVLYWYLWRPCRPIPWKPPRRPAFPEPEVYKHTQTRHYCISFPTYSPRSDGVSASHWLPRITRTFGVLSVGTGRRCCEIYTPLLSHAYRGMQKCVIFLVLRPERDFQGPCGSSIRSGRDPKPSRRSAGTLPSWHAVCQGYLVPRRRDLV